MKLNIACPTTACQRTIVVDDPKQLNSFYEKRIAQEVAGDVLGDEYSGYLFRISGGSDKQGFPMKQGVLTQTRVELLMKAGTTCYNPRRKGERKRKSVRGCIVGPDIATLNLVIVKKGDKDLPGLTDKVMPRRLGPKRASKIRKLFALSKEDDVRRYVIRRKPEVKEGAEGKPPRTKGPKIQRLITPRRLARKRHELAAKKQRATKAKADAAEYHALLRRRLADQRAKRHTHLSKKRQERLSALPAGASATTTTTTTTTTSGGGKAAAAKGSASGAAKAAAAAKKAAPAAAKASGGKKAAAKKPSAASAAAAAAAAASGGGAKKAGAKKAAKGGKGKGKQ